jgi:hypothetical protein
MNRLRDYFGFAVCFAGLGYMAIWPLSASGASGGLFGASFLCRVPPAFGIVRLFCDMPHPLILSPTLHVVGLASATAAALCLMWRALRRARRARAINAIAARRIRIPVALMPARRAKPTRRLPRVKPRSQFGLRGVPR